MCNLQQAAMHQQRLMSTWKCAAHLIPKAASLHSACSSMAAAAGTPLQQNGSVLQHAAALAATQLPSRTQQAAVAMALHTSANTLL